MMQMKELTAVLFVLLLSFAALAGCSPEQPAPVTGPAAETEDPGETGLPSVTLWVGNGAGKVTGDAESTGVRELTVCMARNESECCQISLRAGEDVSGLSLRVEGTYDGISVRSSEEHLLRCGDTLWPDPLTPLADGFPVKKDVTTTLLLCFTAGPTADAGDHLFRISLRDAAGETLGGCAVTVRIWDFSLPEVPSCPAVFELKPEYLRLFRYYPAGDTEKASAVYREYYDLMLSYKTVPFDLPYPITDPRADAYMSDPRVTSFRVKWEEDDMTLSAIYEKLSGNPEWMKKAFFYAFDEPVNTDDLNELAKRVERIRRLCPGIAVNVSYYRNIRYDGERDQIDFMTPLADILTAKSFCWIDRNIYSDGQMKTALPFADRMERLKKEGKRIFWYVCAGPGDPYCNLYINEPGVDHRELFWQQFACGAEGFLYWCADYWKEVNNPWEDMENIKSLTDGVFGDGAVLYPGEKIGLNGPCPSLRLEMIRDGIEDYDLLKLAAGVLGEEAVSGYIDQVTPSLTEHTASAEKFMQVRNALGDALEKALYTLHNE